MKSVLKESQYAAGISGPAVKMEIKDSLGTVSFDVCVVPRASREAIDGEHGGGLKIRLTAPPVDDRANDSLCRLLADRLNVPVSAVRIVAGEKSRTKRVAISGVTRDQVLALVQPQAGPRKNKD